MGIRHRASGPATVLDITPKLFTEVSRDLFVLVIENLLSEGKKNLVVNLSQVRWLDSRGLGLLLAGHRAAEGAGGSIVLAGANDRIRELMRVVGMLQVWKIFDDEAEAVKSFGSEAVG